MKIVGLTGSIGMGKSTVAAMLRDLGVPVFDADAAVHMLQGPGGALVPAIESAFPGTTGAQGVDRARLGPLVLGDDAAMARLEAIVHPAVAAQRSVFLAEQRGAPLVVFDIPLLFEKGGADGMDAVIVVSAPADVQRTRVLGRPGMSAEKFEAILARQTPDAEKRARATYVVDTGTPPEETRSRLEDVVACILAGEGR
jgi:dephospho-CoA kinase